MNELHDWSADCSVCGSIGLLSVRYREDGVDWEQPFNVGSLAFVLAEQIEMAE